MNSRTNLPSTNKLFLLLFLSLSI